MPTGRIGGYYTLSSTAIQLDELPADTTRKLPRHPLLPAFLLGRLAVDLRLRGQGWGRFLLAEAKNDEARRFYERESFLPLPKSPNRLFRGLSDLVPMFRQAR